MTKAVSPKRCRSACLGVDARHGYFIAVRSLDRNEVMRPYLRTLLACAALIGVSVSPNSAPLAQNYRAVDIAANERAAETFITQRINAERARLAPGTPQLAADSSLVSIARQRSDDMAHGAPFAHEDSEGHFVAGEKVQARFGMYGAIGENIMMERDPARAFDAAAFARRAVQGWMNSEGHRANILSPAYDRSGVGVVIAGSYIYATQVFWGPPKRARIERNRRP